MRVIIITLALLFVGCATPILGFGQHATEEKQNRKLDHHEMPVDPEYQHAPEDALESWMDRRFGMRIHWGVYSQLGLDASWPLLNSSDEFKDSYSTLWQVFNPVEFDAAEWAQLAEDTGMKYFVFTAKHHDGFSMFDTEELVNARKRLPRGLLYGVNTIVDTVMHYSMMDTQYPVDITRELVSAFRGKGMGVGLYYSNVDWNDRDQRFIDNHNYFDSTYSKTSDPQGFARAVARQCRQLIELSTKYGPIDQIDFDHGWPIEYWDETVNIIKEVRKLQPNTLFRQRGLGKYGDFMTPEHWLPDSPDDPRLFMPWQAIEHYGQRWAWQPSDVYYGKEWILESLIDCASKGGNFMVGVSPTHTGKFDQRTQDDLRWVGRWLKVNGDAIYGTRGMFVADDHFKFTQSKDGSTVYAIHKGWFEDGRAVVNNLVARPGSEIELLGMRGELKWEQQGADISVKIPISKPDWEHSYVLKIEL